MSRTPTHHRTIKVGNDEVPIHRCASCQQEILWARTNNGKSMPLDLEPNDSGTMILVLRHGEAGGITVGCFYKGVEKALTRGEKRRTSHFSTCPNADQHRGNK